MKSRMLGVREREQIGLPPNERSILDTFTQ